MVSFSEFPRSRACEVVWEIPAREWEHERKGNKPFEQFSQQATLLGSSESQGRTGASELFWPRGEKEGNLASNCCQLLAEDWLPRTLGLAYKEACRIILNLDLDSCAQKCWVPRAFVQGTNSTTTWASMKAKTMEGGQTIDKSKWRETRTPCFLACFKHNCSTFSRLPSRLYFYSDLPHFLDFIYMDCSFLYKKAKVFLFSYH
jgi:hypothetical protein